MNGFNPRLVCLWVATYPGRMANPIICLGCGRKVGWEKVYRLRPDRGIEPYGRELVVGYLCLACRRALGPAKTRRYFTRIEGNG